LFKKKLFEWRRENQLGEEMVRPSPKIYLYAYASLIPIKKKKKKKRPINLKMKPLTFTLLCANARVGHCQVGREQHGDSHGADAQGVLS
jgi:hypothetical protein